MKPRICFFITDTYIPYSPTVLGLYKLLSESFNIDVIIFDNRNYGIQPINWNNVIYIKPSVKKIDLDFQIYKRFSNDKNDLMSYKDYILVRNLKKIFSKNSYSFVIAVDLYALYIAQKAHKGAVHFVSLELHYHDYLISKINTDKIASVLIQRRDRYEYLFPDCEIENIFYVQNTSFYKEVPINITNRDPYVLLHAGTSQDIFGIYAILNFIAKSSEYKVYLKGICPVKRDILKLYNDEFFTKRIIIDESYEDEENIIEFISKFYLGFCFYDLSYKEANNFNYLTAPSGKLFKYIMAGVPIVASDIPGLSMVKEYKIGEVISDLSSLSILSAINKINSNYQEYVKNCLSLAQQLSFEKIAANYIKFLEENSF